MAGSAVGAVLFIWAIGALLGGNDVPSVRGAAHDVPLATSAPSSNPPATGRIPVRGSMTSPASASSSVRATPTTGPATTTPPTTTVTAATTTTTSPAPPQACPDSVMRVTATAAQPVYQVGDHPRLTLRIANGGGVPCVRDVSRQFRSISLLSADGRTTLWSSSYCYAVPTHEILTLQPGQAVAYAITWAGRTAAPGCPVHRTTVPAGKYELVGRLGSVTSPPTVLTIS